MPSIQQALERIIAVEVKEKRKTHHHHPMTSFNSVTSEKKKEYVLLWTQIWYSCQIAMSGNLQCCSDNTILALALL
jgi:hypothetical protein